MTKNNVLYYITFLFVISLFIYLFFLSTNYVINYWTFSQAHINYSDGFVKRGLFGSIALILENKLNIKFINTFNIFFILFYLTNIILYFKLIKKYSNHFLIFIFFALSPTLILFSFNDLGGFQRFDTISIFLILLHSFFVNLYRSKKNTFEKYRRNFIYIIFPIILISIFVHEIQCWSIPFHFFLIKAIFDEKKISLKGIFFYFFILLIASMFVFLYPVDQQTIISMIDKLPNRNLWTGAISVASSLEGNINIISYEIKTNLLNFYNFKINLFFLISGVIPINFIIFYLNKKKIIYIINKNIYFYFYLSIIPYLTFFAIGDTGRWLHLISIVSFGFLTQYPIFKNNHNLVKNKFSFLKFFIFIILIVYCFFIRLPHGGNLQEKKISIWGGLYKKFEAVYMIYFKETKEDKFNFNKRFKKN